MRIIYKTRITRAQRVALLNSGRATISATTNKLTHDCAEIMDGRVLLVQSRNGFLFRNHLL
jgi:hypothetical protein